MLGIPILGIPWRRCVSRSRGSHGNDETHPFCCDRYPGFWRVGGLRGRYGTAGLQITLSAPPPPPVYSWTGFYVGGNGGFGGNDVNYSSTLAGVTGNTSLNSSGFLGGGQAGFNWQVAPLWVIGVETDFDGTDISIATPAHRRRLPPPMPGPKSTGSVPCAAVPASSSRPLRSSTEPAAGPMATPRRRPPPRLSARRLRFQAATSKTAGRRAAGLEYAINPWLSFKTEYLYVNLGSANLAGTVGGVPISLSEKTTAHTVKAGLNFKFGGWTP